MKLMDELLSSRLVAIVRGITRDEARVAGAGLAAGGVKLMEVTMNTEGALDIIHDWRSLYNGQARIGAGTVLNVKMAEEAVSAGAEFLISPNVDLHVIRYALEQGIDIWPGAMTPTEIVTAFYAGAEAVKLFPMASLGLGYLREIRAPLNHIPLIVTGGVSLQNIAEYYEAGASAVGIGSSLLSKDALAAGDATRIAESARAFVQAAFKPNP